MNELYGEINHPIAVGKQVLASKPSCPCKAATYTDVKGTVGKVIHNQAGWWYYLSDIGVTVKGEWIKQIYHARS